MSAGIFETSERVVGHRSVGERVGEACLDAIEYPSEFGHPRAASGVAAAGLECLEGDPSLVQRCLRRMLRLCICHRMRGYPRSVAMQPACCAIGPATLMVKEVSDGA